MFCQPSFWFHNDFKCSLLMTSMSFHPEKSPLVHWDQLPPLRSPGRSMTREWMVTFCCPNLEAAEGGQSTSWAEISGTTPGVKYSLLGFIGQNLAAAGSHNCQSAVIQICRDCNNLVCFLVASSNQIASMSSYTSPDDISSLNSEILLYGRLHGVLAS